MGLTITTPSSTTLLSTVSRIKAELGITVVTYDDLLDVLLRQAGEMAETYCNRIFTRQAYTETRGSYGGPYLNLRQAPVVNLASSTYSDSTLTDITVKDAAQGLLYRKGGFYWTAQSHGGLLSGGRWIDKGWPISGSEMQLWSFVYTAGWIVPDQNRNATTVSVVASDNSFNDSGSTFPSLLKAGDVIEAANFTNAANNGRHVVSGTPTTAKIIVTSSLTNENAAAGRAVIVSNLPGNVERGVIEVVKSLYSNRATASNIVEKQAAVMRLRYSEASYGVPTGLPPSAEGLLRPFRRVVS